MLVRHSFDSRFISKMQEIEDKYGIEMIELEGIGPSSLDINRFAKDFFSKKHISEISSDPNANVDDQTVLSMEYEFGKSIQKLNAYYLLWKKITEDPNLGIKRANKILELCINGTLKIHDLQFFLKPYCYSFSLLPMVTKGLPFISKVKIGPPKHFTSFINLTIQAIAYMSNQIAGACGLPDLFVYMDWYARKEYGEDYLDNEKYKSEIKQEIQSLVYSFNYPYRSSQSSFTNVNLYDTYFLKEMFEKTTLYPDNSTPNIESIIKLQEFYMRWFVEESKTQTLTFPLNTATFFKDETGEIKDKEFLNVVSELNCFNGCFNIYTGDLANLSSCCRLRSNINKAKEYSNSFGVGGVSVGSHRVVTLNLPRIAYQAETDEEFFKQLEYNIKASQDILDVHRLVIKENIEGGKLPLYTHGFMFLNKQFSTIGFLGLNEACEIQGHNICTKAGEEFSRKTLDTINELNEQRTKIDGQIRNMEQVPGESCCVTFAKKDKILFTDHKYKLYSNQYIPLWKNVDVEERIRLQGLFDSMCSGGAILHINVDTSLEAEQMKALIETSAKKGVIYFGVNMNLARCNNCNKLFVGKFDKSPCHNATVSNYMRVVGFLVKVENWIPERREEYKIRQFYTKETFK